MTSSALHHQRDDTARFRAILNSSRLIKSVLVDESTRTDPPSLRRRLILVHPGTAKPRDDFALVSEGSLSSVTGPIGALPQSDAHTCRMSESIPQQLSVLLASVSELSRRVRQSVDNVAAVALLDSWIREDAAKRNEDEAKDLAAIKAALDADRPSTRKLFP